MPQAKCAAALGFFDGVHIGHAALMRRVVQVCNKKGETPAVITFDTLPQNVVGAESCRPSTPLINSAEDKSDLIKRLFGINDIIYLPFDDQMAAMPWNLFLDYLSKTHSIGHLVVGENFKFGNSATGNSERLRQKCQKDGIGCDIIPTVSRGVVASSSSHIRKLLLEGDIESANAFLGHPHILSDTVRSGHKLGSKLGTPTINMRFGNGVLVPAHGVYAVMVYVGLNALPAVTNIGIRPTVGNCETVTVETHVPNFSENLYGQKVRLEFHKYIRPEKKFTSIDELKNQIQKDIAAVTEYFAALE